MLLNNGGTSFTLHWQQSNDAVITVGNPRPARGITTLDFDVDYAVTLGMSTDTVNLIVDGQQVLSHRFNAPVTDGRVGLGTRDSRASFDNLFIRVPATAATLPYGENFNDGVPDALAVMSGAWEVNTFSRYYASPAVNEDAISIIQLTDPLP